jgi:eukaryotic-like serine/threonine-protein kinase
VLGLGLNSKSQAGGRLPAAADNPTAMPQPPSAEDDNAMSTVPLTGASVYPRESTLLKVGELLKGVFRVEKVLPGGMGVVYICRQLKYEEALKSSDARKSAYEQHDLSAPSGPIGDETPRYHAIKSFRRELLFHSDVRARFHREALLWVSLWPHPNIVRAWTFEEAGPLLFLEYVDDGNLSSRLGKPLAPQEVARIALQFCRGMIFLFESAGIVHRDIKPANILLARNGSVKITDFGLARAFSGSQDRSIDFPTTGVFSYDAGFATQCGEIMGSLPWMSPEQLTAPSEVTVTSDVYSFGMVLYEMLTGRMPFTASNSAEWIRRILNETPAPPASTYGADQGASTIVMKCLEKRPEHRFLDFGALRQALESWAVTMGWSSVIPASVTAAEMESGMTAANWAGRGYALGQLGRGEDSYHSYLRALDLDPTHLGIHTNIGSALMRLGRIEEGLKHHEKETEIHPTMALAWDALAGGYLRSNRLREAVNASRKASELAPDNLRIVRLYAFAARRGGATADHQRAVAALKALLDQAAYDNPRSWINEAIQFMQAGDVQTGMELHARSVKKYPGVAAAWYNFGVTMHRNGQWDQAVDFYSRAIKLDSKSTLAWVYRGAIRARRGENELARSDWQAAVANDPNHYLSKAVQIMLRFNFAPQLKEHLDKLDSRAIYVL